VIAAKEIQPPKPQRISKMENDAKLEAEIKNYL
jgi:hypothetical protein